MSSGTFDALLAPGEVIRWEGNGQPAPRNLVRVILLGLVAVVLLGWAAFAFGTVWIPFSRDLGFATVVGYLGEFSLARDALALALGLAALVGAVLALRRPAGAIYALGVGRAFVRMPGKGESSAPQAYAVDLGKDVTVTSVGTLWTLAIPLQPRPGKAEEWVWFERLLEADCRAARAAVSDTSA